MNHPAAHSSAGAGPSNLPAYFTSFVGRARELATILEALEAARLVTLVGPGGIGKTRLGVETARAWHDARAADVFFVDLSLAGPGARVDEVAFETLIPGAATGTEATEGLVAFLGRGAALVVLDNCEHVVDQAASLAMLLQEKCPELRLLATSRTALGVAGEARVPIDPLPAGATSRELFLDRARASDLSFDPTPADLDDIDAICAGMDGVPLAIELAAASVGDLSLGDLRRSLGRALDAFESPVRAAPNRQRTMREAIRWSYDLLGEQERALLGRLSVFADGWKLDSAEEVCSGAGIERREVLRLTRRLAQQGLVTPDAASGRYRLLEPIRQFAAELIHPEAGWQGRHAEAFASLMEDLSQQVRDQPDVALFARLREEDENFRKAAEWALSSNRPEFGLRMVAAGGNEWDQLAARRWRSVAARLLAHPAARSHAELWGLARLREASVQSPGDEREADAIAGVREALEVLADGPHRAVATIIVGKRLAWLGLIDEAEALLHQVLEQVREDDNVPLQMAALTGLAQVAQHKLLWDDHRRYLEESLRLARAATAREQVRGLTEVRTWEAYTRGYLAGGLNQQGKPAEAEAVLRALLEMRASWGYGHTPVDEFVMLATSLLLQDRFTEAAEIFRTALAGAVQVVDTFHITLTVAGIGIALGMSGSLQLGIELLGSVVNEFHESGRKMFPGEREQVRTGIELLRRRASSEDYERWFAQGARMTIAQAAELALSPPAEPDAIAAKHPGGLTGREIEILRLVAAGETNRQIAERLVLSLRTVETHIFNVYNKTNTGGRAAATGWAIANGIYDPRT